MEGVVEHCVICFQVNSGMTNNKTAINNQATEPGRFVEIDFIGIKSRKYGYKLTVFIGTFPGWEEVFLLRLKLATMTAEKLLHEIVAMCCLPLNKGSVHSPDYCPRVTRNSPSFGDKLEITLCL